MGNAFRLHGKSKPIQQAIKQQISVNSKVVFNERIRFVPNQDPSIKQQDFSDASPEDLEMMNLFKTDPEKAKKIMEERNEYYKKEFSQQDSQHDAKITRQYSSNSFRKFGEEYNTIKQQFEEEDDEVDEEYIKNIMMLSDNIKTTTMPQTYKNPIGKALAREQEYSNGKPISRDITPFDRFTNPSKKYPGTYTVLEIDQLFHLLRKTTNTEDRNLIIKQFAENHKMKIETVHKIIFYSNNYVVKTLGSERYGFWQSFQLKPLQKN